MNPNLVSKNFSRSTALLSAVFLLSGFGLLVIYSSSSIPAALKTGDSTVFFTKQLFVWIIGFSAAIALQKIPIKVIKKLTLPAFFLCLFSLLALQVSDSGLSAGGARRWLAFFGFTIQPAELVKLGFALFLAANLSRPKVNTNDLKTGLLPNLLILGSVTALLLLQPDFGTVALLCALSVAMFFVAGLSRKYFTLLIILALSGLSAILVAAPYRLARLTIFLNPWESASTGGFQIIQSYLGLRNGGLAGVGLGESRQKLFFLPQAHTDFIFSFIGEEFGFIGILLIISCFLYILWLGYEISFRSEKKYESFLAFALTTLLTLQACFNIGVCLGLLPTKGITLPFVSHGANSLLVSLLAAGIIARVDREAKSSQKQSLNSINPRIS